MDNNQAFERLESRADVIAQNQLLKWHAKEHDKELEKRRLLSCQNKNTRTSEKLSGDSRTQEIN